ncbi:hypothetical protein NP603_15360 [Methylomonas sp. SURF-1]|uniref:Uncharacterized protein n=1 Tax=Methylomonas aurea TaxID=2952224 RepID=A0ABT1UJU1_9GAMM|nr:hypothetical protein [Methylomonas sp. SURF-1]MCQ8182499.1 hypothetical protein [Methylomonas sp. SURF-1]
MKRKLIHSLMLTLSLPACIAQFQPALAATTAADQDKLRIHTGIPRRASDSLFSYTVEWRIDDGELYRSTGLSFLNASKLDHDNPQAYVAKKIWTAMKDGMVQLDPNWRGVTVIQPKDQPELVIANKAGYSLTNITFRDYSNQALNYELADKTFSADGVQVAVDLVYTADVEYLDDFTSKKAQTASQGEISIAIDGQNPIKIKTDGKTTQELEQELAGKLNAAKLAQTPLYPGMVSTDTRNNKPFDGSELQLLNLPAKSIAIDVSDPALGVLTKFKFKDDNRALQVAEPRFMLALLGLATGLALFYFWRNSNRKRS